MRPLARSRSGLVIAVATVLVWGTAGCTDDRSPGDRPTPKGDPSRSRAERPCLDAGKGEAALHLLAPKSWVAPEQEQPQDAVRLGAAAEGWLPSVTLDLLDEERFEDTSDQELLSRALTLAGEAIGSGPAEVGAARRRIEREKLTEVTVSTSDLGDDQAYTVHARILTVDGARFTVSLFTPQDDYEAVAGEVLVTLEEGLCP